MSNRIDADQATTHGNNTEDPSNFEINPDPPNWDVADPEPFDANPDLQIAEKCWDPVTLFVDPNSYEANPVPSIWNDKDKNKSQILIPNVPVMQGSINHRRNFLFTVSKEL